MSLTISRNGMIGAKTQFEHTATNLANINTPGYTKEFTHHLGQGNDSGSTNGRSTLDMARGTFQSTGRSLDLTAGTNQFFKLGNDSPGFVRSGRFGLDQRGRIVHQSSGRLLQGEEGKLQVSSPDLLDGVKVDRNGTVTGRENGGDAIEVGTIETVTFQNPAGLSRGKDGLLKHTPNSGAPTSVKTDGVKTVMSGRLETTNVSFTQSLVDQQRTLRSFQMNAKAFQAKNQILQRLTSLR